MLHFSAMIPRRAVHQRRVSWALGCVVLAMLALAACGGGGGDNTPSAQSLIQDAQKAINTDSTFHFKLKTDHPGAPSAGTLTINTADGDVKRPDQLKGTATVSMGGPEFGVEFIGIGNQQWIMTPLAPNMWVPADQYGIDLSKVLDPNTGVGALLGAIQNPKNVGDDNVSGDGDCWLVEGTVPSGALAAVVGGDPNGTTPIDTTVCVAKNLDGKNLRQPYEIIIKGAAAEGDTAQTTRTFTLSKFNESIDIQPPPQQ
ncbi:MAG TPA: LppX_LprAFG lipoprotein [Ktedonobacterales bacterium]|nr:LppX_LprAFG lipoprotein [Ktedonobacterales bacterium]